MPIMTVCASIGGRSLACMLGTAFTALVAFSLNWPPAVTWHFQTEHLVPFMANPSA